MKKLTLILLVFFICCDNNDENSDSTNETKIDIVTGINIKDAVGNNELRLGNPNIFLNNQFVAYLTSRTSLRLVTASSENISKAWIITANPDKTYQQTDFNLILNSDIYSENEIASRSDLSFSGFNTPLNDINLADLKAGYYRVFVKINEKFYWDNFFITGNNFEFNDIVNYWK